MRLFRSSLRTLARMLSSIERPISKYLRGTTVEEHTLSVSQSFLNVSTSSLVTVKPMI